LPEAQLPEQIETGRLLLRLPRADDAVALNRAIRDSFHELHAWMDWALEPQTLVQTRAFIQESSQAWQIASTFNCLMVDRASEELIGGSGYAAIDWAVPKFEIGYWCRSDRTGRGYVTETAHALARHAFESFQAARVELRMDDRNERSWRVAERLGFVLEGTLRNDARTTDGGLRDTRVYAVTRREQLLDPRP
jgi:RimJ/RimL family protein N-acetyltransferase